MYNTLIHSQNYEFSGAFIIGKVELMSYKLVFTNTSGKITGYSISDLYGPNETTANISGTMDAKKKKINFFETKIIKTKSTETKDQFCLMHVTGKLEKKLGKEIFQGSFSSKSSNKNVQCDSGTVILTTTKVLYEIAAKMSKKIDSTLLQDSSKSYVNKTLKELTNVKKVTELHDGGSLNLNWSSDKIILEIWDDKLEDGDILEISLNGTIIKNALEIKNKADFVTIPLAKNTTSTLQIKAISEGKYPPNTAKIYLVDGKERYLVLSELKTGNLATVKINH